MTTEIEKLEEVIKEMATASLKVCSMLVASELVESAKSDKIVTVLFSAVEQLHESCTQEAVKAIFDKE